jgi:hypothetical protein
MKMWSVDVLVMVDGCDPKMRSYVSSLHSFVRGVELILSPPFLECGVPNPARNHHYSLCIVMSHLKREIYRARWLGFLGFSIRA